MIRSSIRFLIALKSGCSYKLKYYGTANELIREEINMQCMQSVKHVSDRNKCVICQCIWCMAIWLESELWAMDDYKLLLKRSLLGLSSEIDSTLFKVDLEKVCDQCWVEFYLSKKSWVEFCCSFFLITMEFCWLTIKKIIVDYMLGRIDFGNRWKGWI